MFCIKIPLWRHGGDYGTKDIQVLHYGIWPWKRILNRACISISNLPENIAWQTHRPEARGPLKSGAWGGRPTCHPQTPPLVEIICYFTSVSPYIFLVCSWVVGRKCTFTFSSCPCFVHNKVGFCADCQCDVTLYHSPCVNPLNTELNPICQ